MKPTVITVDDVIRFAAEHGEKPLSALKQRRPFKIRTEKRGIRYVLPNGSNGPIHRDLIQEYLEVYNASAPEDRTTTAIYAGRLRESSYMVSILFAIWKRRQNSKEDQADGFNDLEVPGGNDTPDRASTSSFIVIRDREVRRYVIERAAGASYAPPCVSGGGRSALRWPL